MGEYTFRCTIDLKAKNFESARKKFLNFVAKQHDAGYKDSIEEIILEKKSDTTFQFVSLDEIPDDKRELIEAIQDIKPHNGTTPLWEFSIGQLQKHLIKLGGVVPEKEPPPPPKKKLRRKPV